MNFHVRNGWLNPWHVAADTFRTRRASGVMRVLRYISRLGPVGRPRVMTLEAEARSWFQKVGVIIRAVNIVATETSDARMYIRLVTKSLPCIRLPLPVPSG